MTGGGAVSLLNTARAMASTAPLGSPEPTSSRAELSIVVPAFNEAPILSRTLPRIVETASRYGDCELLVVDDGSTDDTLRVAAGILRGYPRSELIWHPQNLGKGAAVRTGVCRSRGRAVVFVDADLSPDLEDGLERAIDELERAPIAIASRAVEGAEVIGGTLLRRALGLGFRVWRRLVVGLEIADTQCGLKAFRAGAAKALFHFLRSSGFVFDVELLVKAGEIGIPVAEFPIRWEAAEKSSVRPIRDGMRMALDLARLRYRPGRAPAVQSIKIPIEGSALFDATHITDALRHGDLVVRLKDEVLVLLFCVPYEAAAVVAKRLADLIGAARLEVIPISPNVAMEYVRSALLDGESESRSFFV